LVSACAADREETTMQTTGKIAELGPALGSLPPLDRRQPEETARATFALG